jgi:hypothetical protein
MLPIHVYYAIDLVQERHREEARRNARDRERLASGTHAPVRPATPGPVRRTVTRGAAAIRSTVSAVAGSLYDQAVDRAGTPG